MDFQTKCGNSRQSTLRSETGLANQALGIHLIELKKSRLSGKACQYADFCIRQKGMSHHDG